MFHRLLQGVTTRLKSMPTSELLEAVSSVSLPEEIDIEELHVSQPVTSSMRLTICVLSVICFERIRHVMGCKDLRRAHTSLDGGLKGGGQYDRQHRGMWWCASAPNTKTLLLV